MLQGPKSCSQNLVYGKNYNDKVFVSQKFTQASFYGDCVASGFLIIIQYKSTQIVAQIHLSKLGYINTHLAAFPRNFSSTLNASVCNDGQGPWRPLTPRSVCGMPDQRWRAPLLGGLAFSVNEFHVAATTSKKKINLS